MTARDLAPAALLAIAILLAFSGVLDRAGLVGASQGLQIGVLVCAPIWLFNLWRRSRGRPDDR